jgi:glutathione synthase
LWGRPYHGVRIGFSVYLLFSGYTGFDYLGNIPLRIEILRPVMVEAGDARILLIDGTPIPHALVRTPPDDDHRGNISTGATTHCRPITSSEQKICDRVGPVLREKGLMFAGIDVIGEYLTEINVTSPTGIRELDRQCELNIAGDLLQTIESHLQIRRAH